MVKLTNKATGETVTVAKGSKRSMTQVITADSEGAREMEISKAECRKLMSDRYHSGWR